MSEVITLSGIKPDDYGVEKNNDWYISYARYVASKYNHIIPKFYPTNNIDPLNRPERWASRVMRLYSYVFSEQENGVFDFMAIDENNNPLPTKLINTSVIDTLVKHMEGNMQGSISSLPDTTFARAIDTEYFKDKKSVFNLAKMKMDFDFVFKKLHDEGLAFLPTGEKQFKNEEELRKYVDETLQNAMEKFFTAWSKDWLYKTDYMSWVKLLFRYSIPAYFGRVELFTEKGAIKIKVHKPQFCIWDNDYDDEFGRKQRYQGVIEEFSIPQLKSAYPELTKEELDVLNGLAKSNSGYNNSNYSQQLGYSDSIIWYANNNNVPTVTVAKVRFISEGEDGEPTWFQCDLIGDKYAKNCKPCDNLTKNSQGYLNPPFLDYIPEMIAGKNRSPVDRAMDLADRIKGREGKKDLLINRIKGNVVTLFANQFPEGADSMTIAQDIANGLLTLEGVNIDDMNPGERNNFLMRVENIGIDFNSYRALTEAIEMDKNEIRDIFSIPRIALGTQQGVVGKGVQEQTITQATYGVIPLYDGFAQYLNNIIHAACEIKKNLISTSKTENVEEVLQITRREYDVFKLAKKMSLTDMNIYLDNKDAVTEEERSRLMMLFERELQNPNSFVDAEVVAEALACRTNTELRTLLRYKKAVFIGRQEAMKEQEQQAAMMQQQAAIQGQNQLAQTQNAGRIADTTVKGGIDIQKEALKLDAEQEQEPIS